MKFMRRISLLLLASGFLPLAYSQYAPQGPKLYGTGATSTAQQGYSVALSADGNTGIVGGPYDNPAGAEGAAWIYARANGVWTQQGNKLVPVGEVGPGNAGWSVALSADGNTALVGVPNDNAQQFAGAAWVFTRSNGAWTQQQKLVGRVTMGGAHQGIAVALSADGQTAMVGGPGDNSGAGAVWVFTLKNNTWTEQQKLTALDPAGFANFGYTIALSGDGSTAIVGGPTDASFSANSANGAAWIFTQTNNVWKQQGGKLVGKSPVPAFQGLAVAISTDGNTAVIGGPAGGGASVFTRINTSWLQQAGPLAGSAATTQTGDGQGVALSGDGNTLVVGAPGTNDAWVFTRANGMWTRRQELVTSPPPDPTSGLPATWFGYATAISSDAGTLIVGGPRDSTQTLYGLGAAWVYSAVAGSITATAGTPQTAPVGTSFATNLQATVYSAPGVPSPGTTVTFTAPSSGASGAFPGSSQTATAVTDASGNATAPVFTANGTAGNYTVTASAPGVAAAANFNLTNSAVTNAMVTLQTSPANLMVSFDNGPFSPAPLAQSLVIGSIHTIATQSPQPDAGGTQQLFVSWSDGMALSHTITVPVSDTTYTATFNHSGAPSSGQYSQQGNKLVGTGAADPALQGSSVALSADGNTAIVGALCDTPTGDPSNPDCRGAAWIWTRGNGVWTQQQKLTASDAVSSQWFGYSVGLSADGNTAIVGGPGDPNYGAAWIFTRSNGFWTQRQRLQATGQAVAINISFGNAVALSGDGRSAIVGAPQYGFNFGSAWIFTRDASDTWSQQAKLTGTNVGGFNPQQGNAVSLSDDGTTAIVGVPTATPAGGALIFHRAADGTWTQQGNMLTGDAGQNALPGSSVAISGDGQTALVGAPNNLKNPSGAFVYTLVNGVWTQQGGMLTGPVTAAPVDLTNFVSLSRDGNLAVIGGSVDNDAVVYVRAGGVWTAATPLTPTDAGGNAAFGTSAALSADGSTVIVGGPGDNNGAGAAWIFAAGPATPVNTLAAAPRQESPQWQRRVRRRAIPRRQ